MTYDDILSDTKSTLKRCTPTRNRKFYFATLRGHLSNSWALFFTFRLPDL